MIQIYTDGGSRKNPGKSACSFIAVKNTKIVKTFSKFLGIKTNNEAEYYAIIFAISKIKEKEIEIFSDSELVIKQLNDEYKIKSPNLKKLRQKISKLSENRNIKFFNLRRENYFISKADCLLNLELEKN